MKLAIKYGDKKSALKYLDEYFEKGGSGDGIVKSFATMNPMYGFTSKANLEKGKEFMNFLTDNEKEKLQIAQSYYEQTLSLPVNVEQQLKKKGITDDEAKNVIRNYISGKLQE